jgi:hypothetical protein
VLSSVNPNTTGRHQENKLKEVSLKQGIQTDTDESKKRHVSRGQSS